MNHKQINDLYCLGDNLVVGNVISDKRNTWFELREDYIYFMEFLGSDSPIIKKGTRIQFRCLTLNGWRFKLINPIEPFGYEVTFGRSRLLKLKVKEIS